MYFNGIDILVFGSQNIAKEYNISEQIELINYLFSQNIDIDNIDSGLATLVTNTDAISSTWYFELIRKYINDYHFNSVILKIMINRNILQNFAVY